jgi:hypothetical protein
MMQIHEVYLLLAPYLVPFLLTISLCSALFMICNAYVTRIYGKAARALTIPETQALLAGILYRVAVHIRIALFVLVFGAVAILIVTAAVILTILASYEFLASMRHWWGVPLSAVTACALFALRSRQRALYGLIEIVIGLAAISATVLSSYPSDLGLMVATLSGIYVIVRGLDNFGQGIDGLEAILPNRWYRKITTLWASLK